MVMIQMKRIAETNVTLDKNILRKQLQAAYQAYAMESLQISGIWFPLEEEASQKIAEDLSIVIGLVEL